MEFSWSRLGSWIIAAVVGMVYGSAGTVAHAFALGPVPLGLILALLGCGALLTSIRLLTGDRWSALAAGLGMMTAALIFSGAGPGGSVIVPQSTLGMVWTLALPLVVAVVIAWPARFTADPA